MAEMIRWSQMLPCDFLNPRYQVGDLLKIRLQLSPHILESTCRNCTYLNRLYEIFK